MYAAIVHGVTYTGDTIERVQYQVRCAVRVPTRYYVMRQSDGFTVAWCWTNPTTGE